MILLSFLLGICVTVADPVTPQEQVQAAKDLIRRIISDRADEFRIAYLPLASTGGVDTWHLAT